MAEANRKDKLDELITIVSSIVNEKTGVQLGARQAAMVESRVSKRMMDLDINSPEEYIRFLNSQIKSETEALVSLLTTHHTFFFREFPHFHYLERTGLPALVEKLRSENRKTIRVWSAACSKGQEVYSLAMFLSHHLKLIAPDFRFEILGTDVDTQSIAIASNGVYEWEELKEVPRVYLADRWVRGTGEIAAYARIQKSLRDCCSFRTGNLMELGDSSFSWKFDIIFCRNVFIYFTQEQIESVTKSLLKVLAPHGLLFVGLSESVNRLGLPIATVGPSIHTHQVDKSVVHELPRASSADSTPNGSVPQLDSELIRVMCVDDSPTIVSLLKKILTESEGFRVVATAKNGREAAAQLSGLSIDVMTLDIHMPEMTGDEYLRQYFKDGHPPVVVVSSVSRENSTQAMACLDYGAADYVEKPSLASLEERADEIRTKLKCAAAQRATKLRLNNVVSLDNSFAEKKPRSIPLESSLRVLVGGVASRASIRDFIQSLKTPQPATVVLLEGAESLLDSLCKQWMSPNWKAVKLWNPESAEPFLPGYLYVADLAKAISKMPDASVNKRTSILVWGGISKKATQAIDLWPRKHVILEELDVYINISHLNEFRGRAHRVLPSTSFLHHSDEYLVASLD